MRGGTTVRTDPAQRAARRNARLPECDAIALRATIGRGEIEAGLRRVTDEGDPLVPELDQMTRGELAAGDVVGEDARQLGVTGVDEDGGDPGPTDRLDLLVAWGERDEEQAVDPVERRAAAKILVALGRAGDVAENELEVTCLHRLERATEPLDRGGAGEERDDDGETVLRPTPANVATSAIVARASPSRSRSTGTLRDRLEEPTAADIAPVSGAGDGDALSPGDVRRPDLRARPPGGVDWARYLQVLAPCVTTRSF